jgi:predicted PurR-regulated permease PerM
MAHRSDTSVLSLRNHAIFWFISFIAFVLLLSVFKSVLLPFILGMAVAYLLNPIVEKLDHYKLSRGRVAFVCLLIFFICVMSILVALTPILIREINNFADELPDLLEKASQIFDPLLNRLQVITGAQEQSDWADLLREHASKAGNIAGSVLGGVVAGGTAVLDFMTLIVITPIMAYYMIKQWPNMTDTFQSLLPRDNEDTIMGLLKEIDQKLSAFVRGQITVVLILAVAYAVALTVAGLKFGILIGLVAGFMCIIPMVGSVLGLVVSVAVALIQTGGDVVYAGLIAGIFIVGQVIEGYLLTPKLVGDSVGLHPLWVFFALMAGGSLFGIVGMLIAVPVAASASVLVAFGVKLYKDSAYYKASAKPATKKSKRKTSQKSKNAK